MSTFNGEYQIAHVSWTTTTSADTTDAVLSSGSSSTAADTWINGRIYSPHAIPCTTPQSANGIPVVDEAGAYTTTFPIPLMWPFNLEGALGVIFVEDNKIKMKTHEGEDFTIADLEDNDNDELIVNLIAVIAKKKLEEAAEKSGIGAVAK